MCCDINNIRKTTERGIPDLADKIFAGVVDEEQAMNALFKGLRPKLAKELEKRRADEVLWIDAFNCKDIKKLKDYVETYDNEAPEYIGRHIDDAKKLIELIENDDKEWYAVKLKNTVDSYKHYLDIYDNPAPSYRGKYVDQAKKAIKIVTDKEDWAKAQDENTIEGYTRYLSIYDTPDYVGIYVNDAKQAIKVLEDEADWENSVNINTIDSYREYLAKYDTNPPAYKGKYIDEAHQRIEMLLPPPSPEIPIVFPDSPITSPDPRIADDEAWAIAIKFNTIEAYNDYLREYDSQDSASYKGVHVEEAKLAIKRQAEEDWYIAVIEHTLDSYERYLSKYSSISKYVGRYVAQAQYALLRLREEEKDWKIACAEDSLTSYKNFVAKYKAMKTSIHLSQAEEKIKELTLVPIPPHPIKWKKWIFILLALALCWLLWIQWKDNAWPFNITTREAPVEQDITVVVEDVIIPTQEEQDSLIYLQEDVTSNIQEQAPPVEQSTTVVVEDVIIPTQEEQDSLTYSQEDVASNIQEQEAPTFVLPSNFIMVNSGRVKDIVYDNEKESYRYPEYDLDEFYIDAYELTQGEYVRIMGDMKPYNYTYESLKPKGRDWGEEIEVVLRNDKLPVLAKYRDFVEYCNKRSINEGYEGFYIITSNDIKINPNGSGYRLPTSLEWTFAAKGGNLDEQFKHIGGNDLKEVAWYGANSGNRPHPVGQKKPNGLGLYDMAGNIQEFHHTGKNNTRYAHAGPDYMTWKQVHDDYWWSPYCTGIGFDGKDQIYGCRIVFVPKNLSNKNLSINQK